MRNRVDFRCVFHDQPSVGRLTLDDDGTFRCVFLLEGGKVLWPFQGRWTRVHETLLFVTPHGYAEVVATLNPDLTLSFSSMRGGFMRVDMSGQRSSALAYAPKDSGVEHG